MTPAGKKGFLLIHYPDRCAYCAQCEDNCRHAAIRLIDEVEPSTTEREQLVRVLVERRNGADEGRPTCRVGDDGRRLTCTMDQETGSRRFAYGGDPASVLQAKLDL